MPSESVRRRPLRWRPAGLMAVGAILLASCAGTASSAITAARAAAGGTATFAMSAGYLPYWIFPVPTPSDWNFNFEQFEFQTYRPLYWIGSGASPEVNTRLSLANLPVYSNHGTTVTISLKRYRWSDGAPVTSRDVEFWMNLVFANRAKYGPALPGLFPNNVVRASYPSATTFTITFNKAYNHDWLLLQQLSYLVPLPRQTWDRESLSQPIGNYDRTPAGARSVYSFLSRESGTPATYASSPLWKVVDGPWRLSNYQAATGLSTFRPNARYSGPDRPTLSKFEIVPFTSTTAEFDSLRSGSLSYGYVPISDLSQIPYLRSRGYRIVPWRWNASSYAEINYTNPHTKSVLAQLYIRQALQHLVDQRAYVRDIWNGYAVPTYGPVPTTGYSSFPDKFEQIDHYPFSRTAAAGLLAAHGWRRHGGGVAVCQRPGSGSGECGPGVRRGASLAFTFLVPTGQPEILREVEAFKSEASRVGISVALAEHSVSEIYSLGGVCPSAPPCNWDFDTFPPANWVYGAGDGYPGGDEIWSAGNYWGGGYRSSAAQRLIEAVRTATGVAALHREQNFFSLQAPALWLPLPDFQISAIKKTLDVPLPQNPYALIDPSQWHMTR